MVHQYQVVGEEFQVPLEALVVHQLEVEEGVLVLLES